MKAQPGYSRLLVPPKQSFFLFGKRGAESIAIEVKAKRSLAPRDFAGLKAIAELKGVRRRIAVFLGERPYITEDGIEALPAGEFAKELASGSGFWSTKTPGRFVPRSPGFRFSPE